MAVARVVAKCPAPVPAKGKAVSSSARGGRRAASPRSDQAARIAELKMKLRDDDYMNGAILRIATVLSARLTLR
jgi:hypothetical protein